MAMERSEYPAMMATLPPGQAVEVLNERVKLVGVVNAHIADFIAERKRLEEQYATGLRKLARRAPPGDANELGVFSVPWNSLTNALESIADSHQAFAGKIEADVEKPLRNYTFQDRQMQAMGTISGNLASMARDIENAERKTERLTSKGQKAKTTNVASASSELDTAQSQWDSQAPYVFEQLQAVDETRLNKLRDVLTQFQTHEVDRVEKDRTFAEQCLNVILNVETADEIKTFALRTTQGGRLDAARQRSNRMSVVGPSTPSLAAPASPMNDDAASQRSGSIAGSADPEKKTSRLKRLSTVLGRRQSKVIGSTRAGSESPERKQKSGGSAFNSFAGRLGRGRDMPTPLEESDETTPRPRSPLRTMTSATDNEETPAIDGTAQSLAAAGLLPNGSGTSNGLSGHQADVAQLQEPLQPSTPQPSRILEPARDNEGFVVPPSQNDAISQAQREAAEYGDGSQPAYNVNIRNAPIAEEGNDDVTLASLASTLKMQGPPTTQRRAGTVRGRRDVRASVYAPNMSPDAVTEQPLSSTAATQYVTPAMLSNREIDEAFAPSPIAQTSSLTLVQPSAPASSTFGTASPTSPGFPSQPASRGTDSGFSPYGSTTAVAGNIFRPNSSFGQSAADLDNQSVRSGRSLSSSTSQGLSKHPELIAPGLNSSIIETVSAWFENGVCTRSLVIGEVALAYNAPNFSTPLGTETIRLSAFDKLEKVAPNPAFISDAASASAADATKGEYTVNLSQIQKTSVAFKYQVSPSAPGTASPGDHAPLLLSTSWKISPGVAMCIVSYQLNPSYVLAPGVSEVVLNNVTLILHLGADGAKATACQSKPVGVFDRARGLIYWSLGEAVTVGATTQKLLAKFTTESSGGLEARAGAVEAKWEIVGGPTGGGSGGSGLSVLIREEGGESDPFADVGLEGEWRVVGGQRKVCAGTYTAAGVV